MSAPSDLPPIRDVVVTVPKSFGLDTWIEEGDAAGEPWSGGGTAARLTLRELRERIESGGQVDMFDIGGCGCFAGDAT